MNPLIADTRFESLRSRLFGIAYRMLGSRAESEDVVQEAYVRWHQTAQETIQNPEAWLVTTATRLAIDRLRVLKTEREFYKGPWLPEPLVSQAPPPDRDVELASDLSIAFLLLLERLAPEERAAFLLHDVFDSEYAVIAEILGKSEAACRQMIHRARERVRGEQKRFAATDAAKLRLLKQFSAAAEARDESALLALFAPDAAWTADGGGRTPASPRPILGAERIVRLVIGLQTRIYRDRATYHLVSVNGEPGLCIRIDGHLTAVLAIESDAQQIHNVYVVLNPEKISAAN